MKLSPLFDENGAFHKVAVIIVLGVMAALLTSVVAVATTADHEGVLVRQTAWTPPPAFLFLHIQLSKSIRNGIDPASN